MGTSTLKLFWAMLAAAIFIIFHLLVGVGALGFVAHIAGFDIPFFNHGHNCAK